MNHSAVHWKLTEYCKSTILQLQKKKQRINQGVYASVEGDKLYTQNQIFHLFIHICI